MGGRGGSKIEKNSRKIKSKASSSESLSKSMHTNNSSCTNSIFDPFAENEGSRSEFNMQSSNSFSFAMEDISEMNLYNKTSSKKDFNVSFGSFDDFIGLPNEQDIEKKDKERKKKKRSTRKDNNNSTNDNDNENEKKKSESKTRSKK